MRSQPSTMLLYHSSCARSSASSKLAQLDADHQNCWCRSGKAWKAGVPRTTSARWGRRACWASCTTTASWTPGGLFVFSIYLSDRRGGVHVQSGCHWESVMQAGYLPAPSRASNIQMVAGLHAVEARAAAYSAARLPDAPRGMGLCILACPACSSLCDAAEISMHAILTVPCRVCKTRHSNVALRS